MCISRFHTVYLRFVQVFMSLRDTWTKFVENEARIWVEFHSFWLNKSSEAPILMIRYEDLMQDSDVRRG